MLLGHDGIAVNQAKNDVDTPMAVAAQEGHVEVIKSKGELIQW